MAEEKEEALELVVVGSKISVGGVARIHENVLKQLGIKSGDHVVVGFKDKSVLVKAFGDRIIDEGEISLRSRERDRLGVREGDYASVTLHESLKSVIMKKLGR